MSKRVRVDVAYDGTDFSGWAVQPGRRTVAGELLTALHRLFGTTASRATDAGDGTESPGRDSPDRDADGFGAARFGPGLGVAGGLGLTVAGRTDAGVHATGQVCHIDVPADRWEVLAGSLVRKLSGLLPPDIRVHAATEVPPEFDARFSALSRRYEYRVTDAPYGAEPLRRRDTVAWPRPLDVERLNAAAQGLVGEHDYAAFCRRKEHASTIRAVSRLDWRRDADGILIATVRADAFCWSMVRSLVGAQLVAGDGRKPAEWPASLLSRRVRADEVTVAPAHGLTLVEVVYPAGVAPLRERAEVTRRRRDI